MNLFNILEDALNRAKVLRRVEKSIHLKKELREKEKLRLRNLE